MSVDISILVGNAASLVALGHTRIEVWLSTDSGSNYEEITASSAAAAVLTSSEASTTFNMGGKLLKFKINGGTEYSVSFSSIVQNWTPTQVVNRINEVASGRASVSGSSVKITSSTTGRASSVEITYCDADDLGFSVGDIAYGKAARITLSNTVFSYSFSDASGSSSYRYKWRFSANGSNPISDYSAPVYGSTPTSIESENLSVCSARFVGIDGKPVVRTVLVALVSAPATVGSYLVAGENTYSFESGEDGYLQFTLVRGSTVRVAIEGTNFVREFVVPDDDTFDLLTVTADADDGFTVATVATPLSRRSL